MSISIVLWRPAFLSTIVLRFLGRLEQATSPRLCCVSVCSSVVSQSYLAGQIATLMAFLLTGDKHRVSDSPPTLTVTKVLSCALLDIILGPPVLSIPSLPQSVPFLLSPYCPDISTENFLLRRCHSVIRSFRPSFPLAPPVPSSDADLLADS